MQSSPDNMKPDERVIPLLGPLLDENGLTELGSWLIAQLRVVEYWTGREQTEPLGSAASLEAAHPLPAQWEMTHGLDLWPWQRECAEKWLAEGYRGTAKVVTGAGKTIFALDLMERLQREVDPDLRVAIVVPTIVLMHQWCDALQRFSNLPRAAIGRMGGGYKDELTAGRRILVCVLNSAAKLLPRSIEKAQIGDHVLLVVDECHRAGGPTMSEVFKASRRYNLGLSATPERDEDSGSAAGAVNSSGRSGDDMDGISDDVVAANLGPVIYQLSVDEAIAQGILSTFEIRHYGLHLETEERLAYEKHSREIRQLGEVLRGAATRSRSGPPSSLLRFAQSLAARPNSAVCVEAMKYVQEVRRRKQLLYHAQQRANAVLELIRRTIEENPQARVLLFHESISEVMQLYLMLLRSGFRVAVDHSQLPDSIRAESISLFRSGQAQVLVSARALIEGFDVPAADVGIIAASSTSARQRIQTIGRVLRKPKDGSGKKAAVIHSLYMAKTVDEMIFEKLDPSRVTGAERNSFFLWDPPPAEAPEEDRRVDAHTPVEKEGPPRRPRPKETEIDWSGLHPGDAYPGKYDGMEFRFDEQGNVLAPSNQVVTNPQGIGDKVRVVCPEAVHFRVTPHKRAVLCWDRERKTPRLVGFLDEEFRLADAGEVREETGAVYQLKPVRGKRRIVDVHGRFAMLPNQADDPEKGRDAERVVREVEKLEKETGRSIRQVQINRDKGVSCLVDGQRRILCHLEKGLEFH